MLCTKLWYIATGEAAQGTAQFVKMLDCIFDCLNVNSLSLENTTENLSRVAAY